MAKRRAGDDNDGSEDQAMMEIQDRNRRFLRGVVPNAGAAAASTATVVVPSAGSNDNSKEARRQEIVALMAELNKGLNSLAAEAGRYMISVNIDRDNMQQFLNFNTNLTTWMSEQETQISLLQQELDALNAPPVAVAVPVPVPPPAAVVAAPASVAPAQPLLFGGFAAGAPSASITNTVASFSGTATAPVSDNANPSGNNADNDDDVVEAPNPNDEVRRSGEDPDWETVMTSATNVQFYHMSLGAKSDDNGAKVRKVWEKVGPADTVQLQKGKIASAYANKKRIFLRGDDITKPARINMYINGGTNFTLKEDPPIQMDGQTVLKHLANIYFIGHNAGEAHPESFRIHTKVGTARALFARLQELTQGP